MNMEDVEKLKRERDNYKSQVEDLEAIRTAYSQLVELRPNAEAEILGKEKRIEGKYSSVQKYSSLHHSSTRIRDAT